MTFKTRQIRQRPRRRYLKKAQSHAGTLMNFIKNLPPVTKNYIAAAVLVIFGIFVVTKVTLTAYHFIADFNPKNLLQAVGADLKKDEHGYTNILLLGDGGHERDGADLIDTIMVASIDYEKNSVSLLSIPRDLYIEKSDETDVGVVYGGKINELYRNHKNVMEDEEDRFQLFKRVAGDVVNLDIQYYARVDFNAFVEGVDSLGGITVDVQEDIYDPFYPNETDDGYTVFRISKGLQEMDGETALKFVRSRKTTSDFDRAARQQLVLEAIQQKALSLNVLTSPGKLKGLYNLVHENVNTDLKIGEMISLAGFAKQMDRSRLVRKVIHDDPGQEGGFLVTPDRDLYNGQFVLVPFGTGYELIHKYADLVFNQREMFYEPAVIEVLNATPIPGIARNSAYQLIRFGFDVQSIDNYFDEDGNKRYLERSLIEYHDYTEGEDGLVTPRHQSTLNALEGFVKAAALPSRNSFLMSEEQGEKVYEGGKADLSIILGDDYDVFLVN
jgi:LCP family protein required for cell wall assembly